jgi:ribosomal protein L40E
MDALEYLEKLNRMCDFYEDCTGCPFDERKVCEMPISPEDQEWAVKTVAEFVFPLIPICPKCGAEDHPDDTNFCRVCGERIGN